MRSKLMLLAIVIILGITSCARRVTCPTYSEQELKEIKVNNDQDV